MTSDPETVIDRLFDGINQHDIEGFLECFDPEYRSETPAHPQRAFTGREQVRRNWTDFFEDVDDLGADRERMVVDGDTVWLEWRVHGTLPDGKLNLVGVSIMEIADDQIQSARMYLEPVQETGDVTWEEFADTGRDSA